MKVHIWDLAAGGRSRGHVRPVRRKTVAEILRTAYRLHVRDACTRKAVKRCLH